MLARSAAFAILCIRPIYRASRRGDSALSRNFRFSFQQPDTIYPFRNSSAQISSLAGPKARDRVQTMPIRAPTAGRGLLIRFCQTLLRPLLALDRFPAPAAPATLPEATGRLSAEAYCQTAVSSDVLPPAVASSSAHV